MLSPGLLVVHDTGGGGENNVAELTRWKELDNPLLEVAELDVVSRADDTSLVEATTCQSIVEGTCGTCGFAKTYRPFN